MPYRYNREASLARTHKKLVQQQRNLAHDFGNAALEKARRQLARQDREQSNVRKMAYHITQADPTNIVSVRRGCCRFCWGENHEYQRSDWELDRDLNRFIAANKRGQTFNRMGGGGYVKTRNPRPDCPICLGEGESYTSIEDFRKLSQRDRQLIAGVKIGKNGMVEEIKFHDKIAAIGIFAKLDGMITEKKVVKIVDMPEEDLDEYFADNAITIDHNDPAFAPFAAKTTGTESTGRIESINLESASKGESIDPESTIPSESTMHESTNNGETRLERIRRLRNL